MFFFFFILKNSKQSHVFIKLLAFMIIIMRIIILPNRYRGPVQGCKISFFRATPLFVFLVIFLRTPPTGLRATMFRVGDADFDVRISTEIHVPEMVVTFRRSNRNGLRNAVSTVVSGRRVVRHIQRGTTTSPFHVTARSVCTLLFPRVLVLPP